MRTDTCMDVKLKKLLRSSMFLALTFTGGCLLGVFGVRTERTAGDVQYSFDASLQKVTNAFFNVLESRPGTAFHVVSAKEWGEVQPDLHSDNAFIVNPFGEANFTTETDPPLPRIVIFYVAIQTINASTLVVVRIIRSDIVDGVRPGWHGRAWRYRRTSTPTTLSYRLLLDIASELLREQRPAGSLDTGAAPRLQQLK